ncbi:hypothetical protein DACRYDRAFT_113833 [Dacryopinax primogenitus]|uniref:Uncharacterized protein n=1 Tax=Dacryopinax primogenitus (strain DJM 731) TaxID=1858805 RepID=M5G6A6_DACPD|nr:uncharacterized protein DACRYDRAFT_113833 [Dacryopinax primogenitus]EJU05791.1 hypothetical protein DACRYDRAFT_113833 [Dacryopinax primogenitus]
MQARLLVKAVRLALGSGRPPPAQAGARALHTGHRPPTTFLGRLVQRVLPNSAPHHTPTHASQKPFAYRGVHTQRSNLSLSARTFIQQNTAKSLHYVPRPPMASRGIQQVGLGKARNFSTASPLFHTTVKNVPIVVRAFAQADLDLKTSEREGKVKTTRKGRKAQKRTRALHRLAADNVPVSSTSNVPEDLEHYFVDAVPTVLTQVTISLEPFRRSRASSRDDISDSSGSDADFWQSLADIHALYRPHMRRVEAVIRRLEPYAHLRRNEDVIGWSYTCDDEFGLPTAVRFAFAAPVDEVRGWLGDFASARWLTIEDVTPGRERLFASLNTELDAVWNSDSLFPDPITSHAPPMDGSLIALPEWTTLPATPPNDLPASGASTPPDYLTDLGEAWMSGFGTPSEEWEYDNQEEDVLSEGDSVFSFASTGPGGTGMSLQFSAHWETRAQEAVAR